MVPPGVRLQTCSGACLICPKKTVLPAGARCNAMEPCWSASTNIVMLFTSHRNTPDEKVIKRKRRSPAGAWWERICGICHPMRRQGLFFSRSCFQKLTHAKSEEKARKCIVAAAPASSARTEYRQKRTHTTKDRVHTAVDSFSHQCSR